LPKRLERGKVAGPEGPVSVRQGPTSPAERERRRIARGLHDQVGPSLALARMRVGELAAAEQGADGDPRRREALEAARGHLDEAIRSLRAVIFDLSSESLGRTGLDGALRRLGKVVQGAGLAYRFETDGFPKPLSRERGRTLWRAVRELLVNAAKHSKGSVAQVTSVRIGHGLRITVVDDGDGFDLGEAAATIRNKGGYGFRSIAADMRRLGGRMAVDSDPGKGTRVILDVPLGAPGGRAS